MVEHSKLSYEDEKELETLMITKPDIKFLKRCRVLHFGLFDTVVIKDGSPVLAKRSEPQEKFD